MKVNDLLEEIQRCKNIYGDAFLEWDVFAEQLDDRDKKHKSQWRWLTDSEGWQYVECCGFWTKFPTEKVFAINVNY